MRKTKTKTFIIKSPSRIETVLNKWIEKERVNILHTNVFTHNEKQVLLVVYCKNNLCNF